MGIDLPTDEIFTEKRTLNSLNRPIRAKIRPVLGEPVGQLRNPQSTHQANFLKSADPRVRFSQCQNRGRITKPIVY